MVPKQSAMVIKDRFWSKVYIPEDNPDACWLWKAGNHKGYGAFKVDSKYTKAHRFSFLQAGGVLVGERKWVLHKCNNRSCVNPNHLYAGTLSDNTQDMILAGMHNNARKTLCANGHSLSDDNLMNSQLRVGRRRCRVCVNANRRQNWKDKHAKI